MTTASGTGQAPAPSRLPEEQLAPLIVEGISHGFQPAGRGGLGAWRRGDRVTEQVLDDISFTVPPNTLTAIVGPSGCGKSTLLRILAGLEPALGGRARVGDQDLVGRPGEVAFHPQQDALLPWLRTLDNATLGAEIAGVSRNEARERARALLPRFGLAGVERAWPDELSGGMRQRVAVLRTYLMPQPVLILDEPFGALDALTRADLQLWLLDIVERDRRPTVLVTHDIDEAFLVADHVLVLSSRPGRIVHLEQRPGLAERKREYESGNRVNWFNRYVRSGEVRQRAEEHSSTD